VKRSSGGPNAGTSTFTHPVLSSDNLQTVLKCSPQHFLLGEWNVEAFRCVCSQVCM